MSYSFSFAILDPHDPSKIPVVSAANDRVFSNSAGVYGIEVTIPALATRCISNLDPQHSEQNAGLSAIEAALLAPLPPDGATLATVRADLDSVGAMAIFLLRTHDRLPTSPEFKNRVEMIASADKFARGGYPGPRPLPTREYPWNDDSVSSVESSRPLAAIASLVSDFKIDLESRVFLLEDWLLTGEDQEFYRSRVEKERLEMIEALENGEIQYSTVVDGRIATVISSHRAATSIGYSLAPVVVALNPSFKPGPGDPYKKFTICAFEADKFANIQGALKELSLLEPDWGGSPTIGGSPQGTSSQLSIEQVVEVVSRHLK